MRVLFVGHSYVTRMAQGKLEALSRLGVAVGLLAPRVWKPVTGLFEGQALHLPTQSELVRYFPAHVLRSGHIASHLYDPVQLLSAILRFHPRIVQVDQEVYSFTSAQVALAAKLLGKRVVVFGWENLDRPIHVSQRISRKITLALADGVIAGSTRAMDLVQQWGYRGHITTMPQLGVDFHHFGRVHEGNNDGLRIGYIGRMVAEKGGDLLLRAFAAIAEVELQASLLFVGTGPERNSWIALSHDLGIGDRVAWLDPVPHDRVPDIMASVGVLVLPSRSTPWWTEQFGLVLAQAMSMGIPVVGARSGAIPDVIGREDVLFDEGSVDGLTDILLRLVRSRDLRRRLSDWGYDRARRHFSNEAVAQRQLDFFNNALVGVA